MVDEIEVFGMLRPKLFPMNSRFMDVGEKSSSFLYFERHQAVMKLEEIIASS
jgi:hypothetical protein